MKVSIWFCVGIAIDWFWFRIQESFSINHHYTPDTRRSLYLSPRKTPHVDLKSIIFPCGSCLLVTTNFGAVDIHPDQNTPTVLRRFLPVNDKNIRVTFTLPNKVDLLENRSNTPGHSFIENLKCWSKFIVTIQNKICIITNLTYFSIKTKPWNYIQQIYLFPPQIEEEFPDLWISGRKWSEARYRQSASFTLYLLDVNVSISSGIDIYIKPNHNQLSYRCDVFNEMVLIQSITFIKNKTSQFHVFPFCEIRVHLKVTANMQTIRYQDIYFQIDQMLLQTKNISRWAISATEITKDVNHACRKGMDLTKQLFNFTTQKLLICFISDNVWKYIVGTNFNLYSGKATSYTNIKYFMGYDVDSVEFSVEYPPTQIKFIGCGDTFTKSKLLHNILLESFDTYCWIAITIICFAIIPLIWCFLSNHQVIFRKRDFDLTFAVLESVYKNLVEQSTPYSEKLLQGSHIKLLAASISLCLLVVSNAYKNDNMYDLIAPKKFKPFEIFQQLKDSKYLILSEPKIIHVTQSCALHEDAFQKCKKAGYVDAHLIDHFKYGYEPIGEKDEILGVKSHLSDYKYYFQDKGQKMPKRISNIYTNSSLWIAPVFSTVNAYFNKHVDAEHLLLKFGQETQVTENKLAECKQVAFLSPLTRLIELERVLRNQGISKLSVGTEVLFERRLGFYLSGWIPAFVKLRIRSLQSSGIFEWWNKLVVGHLVKLRINSKRFQQTKLGIQNHSSKLNFQHQAWTEKTDHLIYLVLALLFGCLIAFVCCIVEIVWKHGKYLVISFEKCYGKINLKRWLT